MATNRKKNPLKAEPNRELLIRVRYSLEVLNTSFTEYCEKKNIDRRNATRALLGTWKGRKATKLKQQILRDAKLNKNRLTTGQPS